MEKGAVMASPASFAKHPLHPMLVAFPIGLWVFSLVSDIVWRCGATDAWILVAYYCMLGGTIGALAAAVPGFIDYLSIKNPRVNQIATWHMLINFSLVFLFAINLWLRTRSGMDATLPFVLNILGNGLLVVSGWLGGEMVYVHGVAVDCPSQEEPQSHEVAGI
jgi:uncharacterized membrane protein